jgi:hypothetical protein
MKEIRERQHASILEGLNALTEDRVGGGNFTGWVVEVLPLVVGQRSVRGKEWIEVMKVFGISRVWQMNHPHAGKITLVRAGEIVWYLLVTSIRSPQYFNTPDGERSFRPIL